MAIGWRDIGSWLLNWFGVGPAAEEVVEEVQPSGPVVFADTTVLATFRDATEQSVFIDATERTVFRVIG